MNPNNASIVIASYCREQDLIDTLLQLKDHPIEEVVIVDQTPNYSVNGTNQLKSIVDGNQKFKYFKITNIGASYARNYGVSKATNEFIIFIDDDVIIPNDFCEKYLDLINSNKEFDAIAGKVLGLDEVTNFILPKEFEDKHVGFMFRPMNYGRPLPNSDLGTCNMIIKKSVFETLGGFDENLKRLEDSDLAARFLKKGFKSYYDPGISLIHKFTNTGAARNLTHNIKPYPNSEYWEQYFYFTKKNFGIYNGKTFLLYHLKSKFKVKGYLIRPKRLFFALKEVYYGYKTANKKLRDL